MPTIYSTDTNRAREDGWRSHPPTLPPPPAAQQKDTSVPGKQKLQGPSPPAYPHVQPSTDNQLPPIRNLVPGLWEPGTSKSAQQVPSEKGQNCSLISPLRPAGPARKSGHVEGNERSVPRPPFETNLRESESNPDDCHRTTESKKRPPSSPIERADHERTAPSNSIINSNRGTPTNDIQRPLQVSRHAGENTEVRRRSSSEATRQTSERRASDPKPSHQQEILRDPHSALRQLLTPRPMTMSEVQRGRSYGVSKRVLRGGS